MSCRLYLIVSFLVAFLVAGVVAPAAALAYIDPGTGSFIIQGIIAAVLGAGVTLKVFWRRITGRRPESLDDDVEDAHDR